MAVSWASSAYNNSCASPCQSPCAAASCAASWTRNIVVLEYYTMNSTLVPYPKQNKKYSIATQVQITIQGTMVLWYVYYTPGIYARITAGAEHVLCPPASVATDRGISIARNAGAATMSIGAHARGVLRSYPGRPALLALSLPTAPAPRPQR